MITPGRIISGKNSRIVQKSFTINENQANTSTNTSQDVGTGKIVEVRSRLQN